MAAEKGGWPVCDPLLRLAGAAYGGSEETSTTVCGDEGRCEVCNLRKAGCSLMPIAVRRGAATKAGVYCAICGKQVVR